MSYHFRKRDRYIEIFVIEIFDMTLDLLGPIAEASASNLAIKAFNEIFMTFHQGKTPPRPSINKKTIFYKAMKYTKVI